MKKLISILLVVGLSAGSYGFFLYNNPSNNESTKRVGEVIDVVDLVKEFKANEADANAKYLNKDITVSGIVKYINKVGDVSNIILESNDLISSVSCEISKPKRMIENGESITIKGKYVGYLLDVELTKCVIQ